jgi:hypothetical protein
LATASDAPGSAYAAMVVDFYLDAERKSEYEEIVRLTKRNDEESNKKLFGYALEGESEISRSVLNLLTSSCEVAIRLNSILPGEVLFISRD